MTPPPYELDVRPILREGGEPFSAIMEAVGALAPDTQHVGIDVEHGDVGLKATGLQHREGDIARAAGHVEMTERPVLGRVDRGQ